MQINIILSCHKKGWFSFSIVGVGAEEFQIMVVGHRIGARETLGKQSFVKLKISCEIISCNGDQFTVFLGWSFPKPIECICNNLIIYLSSNG